MLPIVRETPWNRDELKRKANGLAITDTTIFIKKFGILSGPDPLEVLNVEMTLIISFSDISEKRNSLGPLFTLYIPFKRGLGLFGIFFLRLTEVFVHDVRDFIFISNNFIFNFYRVNFFVLEVLFKKLLTIFHVSFKFPMFSCSLLEKYSFLSFLFQRLNFISEMFIGLHQICRILLDCRFLQSIPCFPKCMVISI